MKLLILSAIKEWIIKVFGKEKWKEIANATGLGVEQFNQQDAFLSDDRFKGLVNNISKILKLAEDEITNQFVHYWMTDFAPRVYSYYIKKSNTAKEFVLGIFKMNNFMCHIFPNQHLTKVDYQELDSNSLTAVYPSEKSLVDIIAVLRGSSHFFTDKFVIRKINPHSVEIKFEKSETV